MIGPREALHDTETEPVVAGMTRLRHYYRRETFCAAVLARAEVVDEHEIMANRRLLVWYNRRDD